MSETFNDILKSMLADLDNGKSVKEIVASAMKAENLSEQSQANVNKAVEYVDKISQAEESLQEAKQKCASRKEWLDAKVDELMEPLSDKQREVAQSLSDALGNKGIEELAKGL